MKIGSLFGFGGGAKNASSGTSKKLRIPSKKEFKRRLSGKYLRNKVGSVKFGDKEIEKTELQEKLAGLSADVSESTFKERMRKAGISDTKRNKILKAVRKKFVLTNAQPSRDEQTKIEKENEKLKQRNIRRGKAFGVAGITARLYNAPKTTEFTGAASNPQISRGLVPDSNKNDSLGTGIDKNNRLDVSTGGRAKFGGINN